jgi:hypothetical protein
VVIATGPQASFTVRKISFARAFAHFSLSMPCDRQDRTAALVRCPRPPVLSRDCVAKLPSRDVESICVERSCDVI